MISPANLWGTLPKIPTSVKATGQRQAANPNNQCCLASSGNRFAMRDLIFLSDEDGQFAN
jgi:hypothetical protein